MVESIVVIFGEVPTLRVCAIAPGQAFAFQGERFAAETRGRYVFVDRLVDRSQRLVGFQLDDGMPEWTTAPPADPKRLQVPGLRAAQRYLTLGEGGVRVWLDDGARDDFESGEDRMIVLASYLSDRGVFAVQLPTWKHDEQEIASLASGDGAIVSV